MHIVFLLLADFDVLVIQRVQLGQYGTKSANVDFFFVLADFVSANIGVPLYPGGGYRSRDDSSPDMEKGMH